MSSLHNRLVTLRVVCASDLLKELALGLDGLQLKAVIVFAGQSALWLQFFEGYLLEVATRLRINRIGLSSASFLLPVGLLRR